jgi:hypothetical protein
VIQEVQRDLQNVRGLLMRDEIFPEEFVVTINNLIMNIADIWRDKEKERQMLNWGFENARKETDS